MVGGYRFGGGFTQLIACDFAITGDTFDGREAARIRLINKAMPRDPLRSEVLALTQKLMALNPETVRATKLR
jgi:feruloyl-CoA hydratase/lyase